MKSLSLAFAAILLISAVAAQGTPKPTVYEPFTQKEIQEVVVEPQIITDPVPETYHKKHHGHPKKHPMKDEVNIMPAEEGEAMEEMTEQERQERRHQRKVYNRLFKYGIIFGTFVLAAILVKFCVAKKRRSRIMRQQMMNQQLQMQQPYLNTVNAHAYPLNQQPVQMGRPLYPQQRQPQRAYQPQPVAQAIRGRPHDSFIRQQQAQPQIQNQYVEAQIKYHEAEIQKLKELARRQERVQMRREFPIHTTESFQSAQPMRKRSIPVGQPIYDGNSSFASEYPEI